MAGCPDVTTTFVLVHGAFCNSAVWAPTAASSPCAGTGRWPSTSRGTASARGSPSGTWARRTSPPSPKPRVAWQTSARPTTSRLSPTSYAGPPSTARSCYAATWGRVPHTYVRLTEDRAMPLALQDRFIAEADTLTPENPFDVRSVASSHLRFQIHPAEMVGVLDGLAPRS